MKNIKKNSLINKSELNGKFYFQDLLEKAYEIGILNEADIEKLQIACLELLAYKTERYNGGDSSSIRIEIAQTIMESNFYTLGLWLKTFPDADDAVTALKENSIRDGYDLGRKQIEIKLKTARHVHHLAMKNMMKTDNVFYGAGIVDGIKGFFKIYNPDYEAHEIRITADYPLCNPIINLVGIEFIEKYLEAIRYENIFCGYFSENAIHHLLCGYEEGYKDLLFNLFEQVLTTAIGCVLVKVGVLELNISNLQAKQIQSMLLCKSREEVGMMVEEAYKTLVEQLPITSNLVKAYIRKALPKVTANIFTAVKGLTLESVFIESKHLEIEPKIFFSMGEKMDDEKYRHMIDEIMQCRFVTDKIALIKSNHCELGDLEDLFFDAELNQVEITAILKGLEWTEIAALDKRHPYESGIEAIDLSEDEQSFRLELRNYILSLSQEQQYLIKKSNWVFNDKEKV